MVLPDYKGASTVNLMSSIFSHLGKKSMYKKLDIKIKGKVVLIVIDGLGYNYLMQHAKYFKSTRKITTVFPSTTAAALTVFSTGMPVQQHAFTGWYVWLKELGIVSAILPLAFRAGGHFRVPVNKLTSVKSIIQTAVIPNEIKDTGVSDFFYRKKYGYKDLKEFIAQIKKANKRNRSVLAYWPYFDAYAHKFGLGRQTVRHLHKVEKAIASLRLKNTTVIITSDHGFVNVGKVVWIEDYPKIKECLSLPLCGDTRVAYCYIYSYKAKQFEKEVRKLRKYCDVYKSHDLVKKNYFGLFKPDKRLYDRIGDYTIIMKKNYIIRDLLLSRRREAHKGQHSGMSEDEMYVPLIVIS